MPITRTAMLDDDGSGTTGTILNNAWKQELYNQIDGAVSVAGTWTPTDASGAGLVFSSPAGRWYLSNKLLHVWATLSYPATSNTAFATIGGLPYANAVGFSTGFYQTYGVTQSIFLASGGSTIAILHPTTVAARTNADVSGQALVFAGAYLIA